MSCLLNLEGKRCLVTGASRGIGRAAALSLARYGADVALVSRSKPDLEAVAEQVRAQGRQASVAPADISQPGEVEEAFAAAAASLGGIDVVVANAGITLHKRLLESTPSEIDRIVAIDLKGTLHCLQSAARSMMGQDSGGSIIVVTSINAIWPLPGQAVYSGLKAALENMVRCLAVDLGPSHVRVNTVAPGAIMTDMNPMLDGERRRRLESSIPLGRVGTPEDVAEIICFLASDGARYVTGFTFVVDGGLMLRK